MSKTICNENQPRSQTSIYRILFFFLGGIFFLSFLFIFNEQQRGDSSETSPKAQLPSYASFSERGIVRGKVIFTGTPPKLASIDMSSDLNCKCPPGKNTSESFIVGTKQGLGNVFVYLKNPPKLDYPLPSEPVVLDQKGCLYHPRVFGIQVGQKLKVLNPDDTFHNVRSLPKKNGELLFNLGMPASLKVQEIVFSSPDDVENPLFPIKCDVHHWMICYAAVLEHPFFAVTDENGQFQMEGIPVGEYQLTAWHERLAKREFKVIIKKDLPLEMKISFQGP